VAGGGLTVLARQVASLPGTHGFSPIPQPRQSVQIFWRRSRRLQSVLWPHTALLEVGDRCTVRIDTVRSLAGVGAPLLNLVLALVLSRRGYQILHGGALARRGDCIAILGPPGAGKSSLVLAGARLGMEVLSDELVPFRPIGTGFVCPGGNPAIRVDPALVPSGVAPAPAKKAPEDKVMIDVRRLGWRAADGPRRLAVLTLLGPRLGPRQPPCRIERLTPREVLLGLLESTYMRRVLSPDQRRRHLRLCAAAARVLPAYRLSVRQGIPNVSRAARALERLLLRHSASPA